MPRLALSVNAGDAGGAIAQGFLFAHVELHQSFEFMLEQFAVQVLQVAPMWPHSE